ncbi:MAG: hypothetical protein JNK33_02450 [Candidatus Doudnabacteria bacterium]|nr:hypothetical protein [Candidatus Doudnabacteria bacterium]
MKKLHTIEQELAEWGKANRGLPSNAAMVKQQFISRAAARAGEQDSRQVRRVPWFSFALTGLAVVAFVILSPQADKGLLPQAATREQSFIAQPDADTFSMQAAAPTVMSDAGSSMLKAAPQEVTIEDTRQFLKTDYGAYVKTRKVGALSEQLQILVRGLSGRIDSASSSEQTGYVSFVLPAEKLESFRTQLKSLAREKFVNEHVQIENLLSQKVNIEEQTKDVEQQLAQLQVNKNELTDAHNQTVAALQAQLAASSKERARLLTEKQNHSDQALVLEARIAELNRAINGFNAKLGDENVSYMNRLADLDAQLQAQEASKTSLLKQDTQLVNTVATVRGNISLTRVSIWQFMDMYVSLQWLVSGLLLVFAVIGYFFHRRRSNLLVI